MRKKSHILLARYLADQMQTTASLQSHRKAFCLGSILPDIKPSFITRRHEFYGTFEDVKNRMKELADIRPDESNQRVYWRRFGEVIHYMADYFTFPHIHTHFLQHCAPNLISTNCSAAKQLPQFSSYLNIKYLSNVSIK